MPRASFAGEWLHRDLFEMDAAYGFHICQNHPFVDGNKRAGLACALAFLETNGVALDDTQRRLHGAMVGVAQGELDKLCLAEVFRALPASRSP